MMALARELVDIYRRGRLAHLGSRPSWRRVGRDIQMFLDPADWMDRAFYLNTYDPWLLYVIERVLRSGDVCLDIGAHKGYVALHMARLVGPGGRVFAFEPDSRARRCLENHRGRNEMPQIDVLPYALGAENGNRAFALSTQLGWSSFFPNAEARLVARETVDVPVRSLDRLRDAGEIELDVVRLAFVKIDAEGAESLVLAGMRETLTASRSVLWLEINPASLQAAGVDARDVERPLRELGYRLFLPHRVRRLGAPRVLLESVAALDVHGDTVIDLLACRDVPPGIGLT